MTKIVYRNFTQAALNDGYDNTKAVPSVPLYRADRAKRSLEVYASTRVERDLAYGPGARHRIDFLHCGQPRRPTLAYIHGGYWQWNEKEPQAFVAEGLLKRGINVVNVEYSLAPTVKMTDIVDEIQSCMRWLLPRLSEQFGASEKLLVSGHSAGGHLTAIALEVPGVHAGIAISGIYDLEPIQLCYLNEVVRMTPDEARLCSPVHRTPGRAPCLVTAGGAELPELVRQTFDYANFLRGRGIDATELLTPHDEHFSILEQLARADGLLANAAMKMAGL